MDLAQNNFSTLMYGQRGWEGTGYVRIRDAMCACAISVECAARRGNCKIAKEPELISQQRKVILKKQVYHSDQYKNWTSMICFVAY